MMKLQIVRRWGANQPGATVDVADEAQARWLLDNSFAVRKNEPATAYGNPAAPGVTVDPQAGGDYTRRRPVTRKSSVRDNDAWPVSGSPRPYTAGVRDTASDSVPADGDPVGDEAKPARGRRKTA